MARITAEDMAGAVEILPAMAGYDPDMAEAFDDLRESLDTSQTDSTLWVHRVPLDERGEMVTNSKHVHLFTAPLDRYKLDEIIAKVKGEYMRPDERLACIRLIAKVAGQRGNKFNKVLLIEKELKPTAPASEAGRESVAEILRAIQESNNGQMAALRQIFAERMNAPQIPQKDPIDTAVALMGAMSQMVAIMNKGAAPVAPAASLTEQIRAMKELKDLAGDLLGETSGGGGGEDNSAVGIIKAVSPLAGPLLQILARQSAANPAPRQRPALPAPNLPTPNPAPQFSTNPAAQPAPVNPVSSEDQKMIAELRAQLIAICEAAAGGANAADLGAVIVDNLQPDSDAETRLLEMLDDPEWLRKLAAIHPGVKAHETFFVSLRQSILAAFDDSEAPAVPAATAATAAIIPTGQ
jgi:hypothetical protein